MRKFAPEIGYVITTGDDYGPAVEYGISLMEGTGRFGWGFTFLGHSKSSMWASETKNGIYRYKEELSSRRLALLGIWIVGNQETPNREARGQEPPEQEARPLLVVGLGPQIYFLKGVKTHLDGGYSESVRENRLGFGALARYERPVPALGGTTFVVTASLSWMESSSPTLDPYQLPTDPVTSGEITVGLAFPF